MSDSLREQMLKAGFKQTEESKPKPRRNKSQAGRNKSRGSQQNKSRTAHQPSSMELANIAEREAIAERKRIKGEIKTIIEAVKVDNAKGELAHGYQVGKRIKQMFVTEDIKNKLVSGELVITRLNGSTYLIPADDGKRVKALNKDWVVITPGSDGSNDIDDDYADYQVPDDLQW